MKKNSSKTMPLHGLGLATPNQIIKMVSHASVTVYIFIFSRQMDIPLPHEQMKKRPRNKEGVTPASKAPSPPNTSPRTHTLKPKTYLGSTILHALWDTTDSISLPFLLQRIALEFKLLSN